MEIRWQGRGKRNRRVKIVARFEHWPNGVYGGSHATRAEAAREAIMRLIGYQNELARELKATEQAIEKLTGVAKEMPPIDYHLNKDFDNIVNTPSRHHP